MPKNEVENYTEDIFLGEKKNYHEDGHNKKKLKINNIYPTV